jgi:hypothetical protein
MPKYTKSELALEIDQLKQQLRERERERESRIMKWLILTVNFNSDCSDNYLYHEKQ